MCFVFLHFPPFYFHLSAHLYLSLFALHLHRTRMFKMCFYGVWYLSISSDEISGLRLLVKLIDFFLADRTNGCAYSVMLCLSVCRLSVTCLLWLNGTSYRKSV